MSQCSPRLVEGDLSSCWSIQFDAKRKKKNDFTFQMIELTVKVKDVFEPCLGVLMRTGS